MPNNFKVKFFLLCVLTLAITSGSFGKAATVEELRQKSTSLSDEIRKLDQEILSINKQLNTTKAEKQTLNGELQKIETTRKKLLTELTLTGKKIAQSDVNLAQLSSAITTKVRDIDQNKIAIAEAVRQVRDRETDSLLEIFLAGTPMSEIMNEIEALSKLQNQLNEQVENLRQNKYALETQKTEEEIEKKVLAGLKNQLSGQKLVVEENKKEKNTLLKQTQSKESNYQKLLTERLEKKRQVEAEMSDLERQIKIAIDPSSLPKTGTGILQWPVDKVIITQYFGNTEFASKNSQVYNGKGHNGIDLGIPVGTPIKSASEGKIVGTGDTDQTCPGASYGKWVLVEHTNGLSTLYAHLSVIRVAEGQTVYSGQPIAFSGNTGYSTGPHLHFTVYASQAVKVSALQSKVKGCGVYRMPISSYNGYLNPLSYLGK